MCSQEPTLIRPTDHHVEALSWGRLVWMVSGSMENSSSMTLGRCYIEPGHANPRHYHPNCEEVLHVLEGMVEHSLDDSIVKLQAGDTVTIPQGTVHNARNIGVGQAVCLICFSTAERQVVNADA